MYNHNAGRLAHKPPQYIHTKFSYFNNLFTIEILTNGNIWGIVVTVVSTHNVRVLKLALGKGGEVSGRTQREKKADIGGCC